MADRDYRRDDDERERYRVMNEMEDNRDRRVRDAFHSAGYGEHGPGGLGRVDPSRQGRDRYADDHYGRDDERYARGYGREERGYGRDLERRGPPQPDHRGRGPRGYKRSDQRIQEDVNDRLMDDPHLDASEIQVHVSEGEVTLTGNVGSRADRRRAEDIAESVSGVSYVMNNVRVRQHGTTGATG
jgi:osmotically-inducible protein OsmY